MATVSSMPHSPQIPHIAMSSRRPPLANVSNAANSPHHRPMLVPAKRLRSTNNQIEIPYGQPPPKKQTLQNTDQDANPSTYIKPSSYYATDSKLFARRANNSQPSAFERKLVAARDVEKLRQVKGLRHEKPTAEALDTIRQWQKHYRKAFPQFVFYFDSVPADHRAKLARQITALGAQEEKFFSRIVTHVVTSRPIPLESNVTDRSGPDSYTTEQPTTGSLDTVNPSLLERTANPHTQIKGDPCHGQSVNDVLYRARKMGMKVWALEKLQRMIAAINDGETSVYRFSVRGTNTGGSNPRGKEENTLSQVLRDERVNGPSDRGPFSKSRELIMFKGPFIYVYDANEKTKPVIVRDYPKVAQREDGSWPQFRSVPTGKCPFVEEPAGRGTRPRAQPRAKESQPTCKPVKQGDMKQASTAAGEDRQQHEQVDPSKQHDIRKISVKEESPKKSSEAIMPPQVLRAGPFFLGHEPAASGVQPSNITSAIRSQMISSATAAYGAKAAVSKEVHELKRKVLRGVNDSITTNTTISRSAGRPADPLAGLNTLKDNVGRSCKANMRGIFEYANEEDTTQSEGNEVPKQRYGSRKSRNPSEGRRRDPKPGYCENCREKFNDFEEHTKSRKHVKFAFTLSNWTELDDLLEQLKRPLLPMYRNLVPRP